MDRRDFFRNSLSKAKTRVVQQVDAKVSQRAAHWIRPPFALDELEFLLACTRCDACKNACPHQVIFTLSARLGAQVAGTPALDLVNKGCHLCEDWNCVASCEAGALTIPVGEVPENEVKQPLRPVLAQARILSQHCLPYSGPECGACADSCPVPGALQWEQQKPRIDQQLCIGCALCREACIVAPKAIEIASRYRERLG